MSTDSRLAIQQPQELSIPAMLTGVIQSGVTKDNVEAIERLCGLYERMEAKSSEKAFAAALKATQNEMPVIVASSVIPNRGKYERFEDLMHVVGPILARNGFSVTFDNSWNENRVTETCSLSHEGGHTRKNSFTCRVGGKADSDTQADCKAATTAKRNALMNALNIVIRQDCMAEEDDAKNIGEYVTEQEARELRMRAEQCGADIKRFLDLFQAESFTRIPSNRLAEAQRQLAKKERANKAAGDETEHTWK